MSATKIFSAITPLVVATALIGCATGMKDFPAVETNAALDVLNYLSKGETEKARSQFSESLRESFPEAEMKNMWTETVADLGEYQGVFSFNANNTLVDDNLFVQCVLNAKFAKGEAFFFSEIDDSGMIVAFTKVNTQKP